MRVGILTFQFSVNPGAQLQSLAMQETLRKMGHETEIIQYYPSDPNPKFYKGVDMRGFSIIEKLKSVYFRFRYLYAIRNRYEEFKNKYLQRSVYCDVSNIADVANQYDAILVGSDQVWGIAYQDSFVFFIGWTPEFKGLRISYAPCCAKNLYNENNRLELSKLLNQFDHISVRNLETSHFVRDLIGLDPPIVLDPTFLYDFPNFADSFKPPFDKYILTYVLGDEILGGHQRMIQEIRSIHGNLPIISICFPDKSIQIVKMSNKIFWSPNPEEWVSLIAKSTYFYTDSFHGVVFALKYKKSFVGYYVNSMRASRFIDLVERFSLGSVITTSVQDALDRHCLTSLIDYTSIDLLLEKETLYSMNFLKKALSLENER